MKKIALFTDMHHEHGRPVFKPTYLTSYFELSQALTDHGGQLYITRDQNSYLGHGSFSQSWIMTDTGLEEAGPIVADVIFDKGRFQSDDTIPVFNSRKIKQICDDKWLMYQTFPLYCPQTFFVTNENELYSVLPNISTDRTVFKPFSGAEGRGVLIEEKNYFLDHPDQLQFPAVVSDFIDTSGGIPGIVDGLHDLRVAIFDGEILYSYVRTPPQGSFLANVSKGGTFAMIDPNKLPSPIVNIVKKIDATLSDCSHRFYGIDFGCTAQGPKIIEMNSELGLLPNSDHPVFVTLKQKLAEVFMEL